ncbi:MAG: acyltransferase [Actinobacteria bacterium]|nr:acyltransferase [Actinomycetota bacterium]
MTRPVDPSRRDGFDTLRMVSAVLVIVVHGEVLTGRPLVAGWNGAVVGVPVLSGFMAISGYMVTASWLRDPSAVRYIGRRVLRIMPALAVVLVFDVVVIGPLFTTLPLGEYWRHPHTTEYLWHNLLLFPQQHALPGVFADNIYPDAVNGSLWTLAADAVIYGGVLLLGVLGLLRRRWSVVLLLILVAVVTHAYTTGALALPERLFNVPTWGMVACLAAACAGIAARVFAHRLRWNWWAVGGCFVAYLAFAPTPLHEVTRMFLVTYIVLGLAHLLPYRLRIPGVIAQASYGVYIYAFPIQQTLVHFGVRDPWLLSLAAVPVALALGLLSWYLVESPAMQLRRRYFRGRAPRVAPVAARPAPVPPGVTSLYGSVRT